MITPVNTGEFVSLLKELPVIDVRSPREFEQGHVPGALNLPLFDNEERKNVGITYKKRGRDKALLEGLDLAGKKLSGFVNFVNRNTRNKKVLLHCWRGGMRSESMAWLLSLAGYQVFLMQGGYKAYRKYIRQLWEEPCRFIVLSGKTGSGKTEILRLLKENGKQVLDIEYHARHKGSAFGALDGEAQPTTEQFENNLAEEWMKFNKDDYIWTEDESQTIGCVRLPDMLYKQIRKSMVILMDLPKELRIVRLVKDYSKVPKTLLIHSVEKIERRLGGQNAKAAIEALEKDDFKTAAGVILHYYDKAYEYNLNKRNPEKIINITSDMPDPKSNVQVILGKIYLHR